MAILKGSGESVLLHLRRGAAINGRDESGLTPLMLAASAGRTIICQLLLAEGASSLLLSNDKQTASALAAAAGHHELSNTLNPSQKNDSGEAKQLHTANASTTPAPNLTIEFNLAATQWEDVPDFQYVDGNLAVNDSSRHLQKLYSRARSNNNDATWGEISVNLPSPDARQLTPRLNKAKSFLIEALDGGITDHQVSRIIRGRLKGLKSILDDLGVHQRDNFFEQHLVFDSQDRTYAVHDADHLNQGLEAIEALLRSDEPHEIYRRELAAIPNVDRAAETSMFRALNNAKMKVTALLPECLPEDRSRLALIFRRAESQQIDEECELFPDEPEGLDSSSVFTAGEQKHVAHAYADRIDWNEIELDRDFVNRLKEFIRDDPVLKGKIEILSGLIDKYIDIRNRIVESYLPAVLKTAERTRASGLEKADVVQYGSFGLMKAVQRFDVTKGNRFITYASWWIWQSIGRSAADYGRLIRIPVHITGHLKKVRRESERYELQTGRKPTSKEIADNAEMPLQIVERSLEIVKDPIRVGAIDSDKFELRTKYTNKDEGVVSPLSLLLKSELEQVVSQALVGLSPREERVLRMRFGLNIGSDMTLEEIGKTFEVTRERIRQIENRAVLKLARLGRFKALQSMAAR